MNNTITRKKLKEIIKAAIRTIIKEMTTTGDIAPINLPGNISGGWVSKQGGSKRGVEGSNSLGYELTPLGKKEMQRKQDPV